MHLLDEALAVLEQIQHLQRGGHDGGGHGVGEQVGAGLLPQPVDGDLLPGDVAAGGAAQGLAEGAGHEVHAAHDAAVLVGPAPVGTHEAHGVAVVHHDHGAVFLRQVADRAELGDVAVHAEHAIRHHQLEPGASGIRGLELGLQIRHVGVGVAEALGLAEADAVDDGSVVQRIADDGVLLAHQAFEDGAVGIEAARVQLGVLEAQEGGQLLLQLPVDVLGAADEAHRGHAEAVPIHHGLAGRDHLGVVGQAQVVVGAEADHILAVGLHLGLLGRGDDALSLVEPGLLQQLDLAGQVGQVGRIHGGLLSVKTP